MPSRCNPVPYCRIHCRTLQSCTVLPNAVKLRRTAESVLCYAGKLCRGNSYVPRLCEARLRQKRNKNEKSTHVRKSDPINSESHTRHSRNHPCPTPSSRKNIGPSPQIAFTCSSRTTQRCLLSGRLQRRIGRFVQRRKVSM